MFREAAGPQLVCIKIVDIVGVVNTNPRPKVVQNVAERSLLLRVM